MVPPSVPSMSMLCIANITATGATRNAPKHADSPMALYSGQDLHNALLDLPEGDRTYTSTSQKHIHRVTTNTQTPTALPCASITSPYHAAGLTRSAHPCHHQTPAPRGSCSAVRNPVEQTCTGIVHWTLDIGVFLLWIGGAG